MGMFYNTVLKMREHGRHLKASEKPVAPAKPKAEAKKPKETVVEKPKEAEVKKPKETAVKKNDKGTDSES